MWRLQIEPYPFTTPPVAGETTTSYLARLAAVNSVPPTVVLSHIAEHTISSQLRTGSWEDHDLALNQDAAARLAAVASVPMPTLYRTLSLDQLDAYSPLRPEIPFAQFHRLATTNTRRLPVKGCPRCAHTRGFPFRPRVYLSGDRVACVRHRLWLADQHKEQPLDLDAHPELLAALRRFLRLCRRGRRQALEAFETSYWIWSNYRIGLRSKKKNFVQQRWRNFTTALPARRQAEALAARYREIVALACMICSPYWSAAALQPHIRPSLYRPWEHRVRPDLRDFLIELARRIDHPTPQSFSSNAGSVTSWALQKQRLHAKRARNYDHTADHGGQ